MLGKEIESFFCEPPVMGQYVNLNQESTDKHLAISGIAVYSESAREFNVYAVSSQASQTI